MQLKKYVNLVIMELAQRMLCDNNANYENLLSNVILSKNTLTCDEGLVTESPAIQILNSLFKNKSEDCLIKWGLWRDRTGDRQLDDEMGYLKSCFQDVIFNFFKCGCDYGSHPYKVIFNNCTAKAYNLTGVSPAVEADECELFSKVADAYAEYLGNDLIGKNFNEAMIVINALCQILNKRAELDRSLKKIVLTVN